MFPVSKRKIYFRKVSGIGVHLLYPDSIISEEAFGTFKRIQFITPSSVVSDESFGTAKIKGVRTIASGIEGEEVFGAPSIQRVIRPDSIASAEAFTLAKRNQILAAISITSEEGLGTPKIKGIHHPYSIKSEEYVEEPTHITSGRCFVFSIPSSEIFDLSRRKRVERLNRFYFAKDQLLPQNAGSEGPFQYDHKKLSLPISTNEGSFDYEQNTLRRFE